MSEDEANRMLYEARLKAWRDEQSRLQGARNEGQTEGRQEKAIEIARNFKQLGIPIEQIAQATGLSAGEIAAL
jgi:predicted transposase/invertase (TIGR01784 family)